MTSFFVEYLNMILDKEVPMWIQNKFFQMFCCEKEDFFSQILLYVSKILLFLLQKLPIVDEKKKKHIKGERLVRRRNIFDVSGKRHKCPLNALSKRNFLCEKETYKKLWKSWFFWGFIPFSCLISSQIICFSAVKVGRSFVRKTKNTLNNWYFWQ